MDPIKPSDKPTRPRASAMSADALIGLGVTVGSLGILGLLLGWAQLMRGVTSSSALWMPIGAVLFVLGTLVAALAWMGKLR